MIGSKSDPPPPPLSYFYNLLSANDLISLSLFSGGLCNENKGITGGVLQEVDSEAVFNMPDLF